MSFTDNENVHVNIGTSQIKNSDCERLLGIDIDCKLSFENHINQICSKARAKLKALARIAPILNKRKRKLLMKHPASVPQLNPPRRVPR